MRSFSGTSAARSDRVEALEPLNRLWRHAVWADAKLLESLRGSHDVPDEAVREYAHLLGAYEVWLSRLSSRPARTAVWPEASLDELAALLEETSRGYETYLASLDPSKLGETIAYVNSAGRSFETPVGDVLLHVFLHAQYHRGKINLLLRSAGASPAPADYIAFARGGAAATRDDEKA
jgi:uncharacterized damage-inducible protein DinB